MIQGQLRIEQDLVRRSWRFKIDRKIIFIPISMIAFWLDYFFLCDVVSSGTTIEYRATRSMYLLFCSVLAYLLTFFYNVFDKNFESRVNLTTL